MDSDQQNLAIPPPNLSPGQGVNLQEELTSPEELELRNTAIQRLEEARNPKVNAVEVLRTFGNWLRSLLARGK